MTKDIDPAHVRVLKELPVCLVLGPLGCYHVGQTLDLPGHGSVQVTSIDPDAAGIGRTLAQMAAMPEGGFSPNFRTSYGADWASTQVHEWMLDQQERNRREHDVTLSDEDLRSAA